MADEVTARHADGTASAKAPDVDGSRRLDETLGQRLRRLRELRGLSLLTIAGRIGVTSPAVWKWENGKARPRSKYIEPLATVLRVSIEELLNGGRPGLGKAPGGLSEKARPDLGEVIEQCKHRIAEAAGTSPSSIRISVEFRPTSMVIEPERTSANHP